MPEPLRMHGISRHAPSAMTADDTVLAYRSRLGPDVIAVATFLVVAVMVLGFGWQNWPSSDDYCNAITVANNGIASALLWLYDNWSGRLITSLLLYVAVSVLAIPELRIVSTIVAAAFLLVAWQLTRLAQPLEAPLSIPMFAFVVVALVVGLEPLAGQVIYWPTGGIVYMLPLVLALHWMQGLRRLVDREPARKHHGYWFFASVVLGNSIELLAPLVLAYAAASIWPRRRTLTAAQRRGVVVRAAGLACGLFVLLAAPGNIRRGNATPGSFTFDPYALALHYVEMWWSVVHACATMVAITLALAIVALVLSRLHHTSVSARNGATSRLGEPVALVAGGCASLVFVLAAPAQFAPRNGLYMIVGFFLAALIMIGPRLAGRTGDVLGWTFSILAASAGLVAAERFAADYEVAMYRRAAHIARDAYLRAPINNGQDVIVRPIRPYASRRLHAVDVAPDPGTFTNACVAMYYGVRSIRLGEQGGP